MIEPNYVTFEQAKLLKEKGFNLETHYNFDLTGEIHHIGLLNHNVHLLKISRPEQWQVVEWLRVNHGIDFNITRLPLKAVKASSDKGTALLKNYLIWISKQDRNPIALPNNFYGDTPQEAYSVAFDYIFQNNLI